MVCEIKTCLFDMGNVLVYFSHPRMCQQMGDLVGVSGDEIRAWLFGEGWLIKLERGEISDPDFTKVFNQRFRSSVTLEALKLASSDIFQPIEGMRPIVDAIRAQGIRLVLLSNTSRAHIEFLLEQHDFLQKFDHMVLSYEVGAMKPDRAIYEAALREIQCSPQECFYTDDIADFIEAARKLGLQAEVFQTPEKLRLDLANRGLIL